MIEDLEFLGRCKDENEIDEKIKDKLGLSLQDMKSNLSDWLFKNASEVASELINIAPNGDYEKLIEETSDMATFLKSEVKDESWKLKYVECMNDNLLKFMFSSNAVDDGETFCGYVLVSISGKIRHAFCNGDN